MAVDPGVSARSALFSKLRENVIGLDTEFTLATGERTRRIYLDSTASTLRLGVVQDVLDEFMKYYANTHSVLHFGAKLCTQEYRRAHETVLEFVKADPERYTAFFTGSGTTAGVNHIARLLREARPDKDVVVTSIMEHHSNDLPHRKHFPEVVHVPAAMAASSLGCVDLRRMEKALEQHEGRVNYVAVTGVSNVTGIINPVHEIAEMAHRHGAFVLVDGAQMAAHVPIRVSGNTPPESDIDFLVFSGHKVYAPGSPGVVVAPKAVLARLEPQVVGGGMVDRVYVNRYTVSQRFPDREEAGTPNIPGAIGLAAALRALSLVGMDFVEEEECRLIENALAKLQKVPDLVVYGETDCAECKRTGAISFNIKGLDHALTAAALNDYFNIAVRNECFCAHPYVREMITLSLSEEDLTDDELEELADLHQGMVRASFGIYNTEPDVDALTAALQKISADKASFEKKYERLPNGDYVHREFRFEPDELFSVERAVEDAFGL